MTVTVNPNGTNGSDSDNFVVKIKKEKPTHKIFSYGL